MKTKVDQAFHEWLLAFKDYSRTIRELKQKLTVLEDHEIQTRAGKFKMKPSELNFWSSGTYLPFKQKVETALEQIEEIEREGAISYLREHSSDARKGIFVLVSEVRKWNDELSGITNCILCERTLSDHRWVLGRLLAEELEKVGYKTKKKGYRCPKESIKQAEWYPKQPMFDQNPLECYDLVETIQGQDFLQISFVPVRKNGVAIRNECILSLSANTLQGRDLTNDVLNTNICRIRKISPDLGIVGIPTGLDQMKRIESEETKRNTRPNPYEQIRYYEKKYH